MQKRKSPPDLVVKENAVPEERNSQTRQEEKIMIEIDEEEKCNGGKDGDNDVVVTPGKQTIEDGGEVEKKSWRHEGTEKSSLGWQTRTNVAASASIIDGAPSQDSHQSQTDVLESGRRSRSSREDKESGVGGAGCSSRSRRKEAVNVGRSTEKIEKIDAATEMEDAVLAIKVETQSTKEDGRSSRRRYSERSQEVSVDGTSQTVYTTRGVQATQAKDDHHTQTTGSAAREAAKHNETVNFLTERIKILEYEKTAIERDREETQKLLNRKIKEHKLREEEFMNLKAGYDRELRTVINEHKKVGDSNRNRLAYIHYCNMKWMGNPPTKPPCSFRKYAATTTP